MTNQVIFLTKVILSSIFLSFLVKYGGGFLPLPANSYVALTMVLSPPLILLLLLLNRNKINNYHS
jgi:hypothetical protein